MVFFQFVLPCDAVLAENEITIHAEIVVFPHTSKQVMVICCVPYTSFKHNSRESCYLSHDKKSWYNLQFIQNAIITCIAFPVSRTCYTNVFI